MEGYGKLFDWVAEAGEKVSKKLEEAVDESGFNIEDTLDHAQRALQERTAAFASNVSNVDLLIGSALDSLARRSTSGEEDKMKAPPTSPSASKAPAIAEDESEEDWDLTEALDDLANDLPQPLVSATGHSTHVLNDSPLSPTSTSLDQSTLPTLSFIPNGTVQTGTPYPSTEPPSASGTTDAINSSKSRPMNAADFIPSAFGAHLQHLVGVGGELFHSGHRSFTELHRSFDPGVSLSPRESGADGMGPSNQRVGQDGFREGQMFNAIHSKAQPKTSVLASRLNAHHPDYWIFAQNFTWLCVALLGLQNPTVPQTPPSATRCDQLPYLPRSASILNAKRGHLSRSDTEATVSRIANNVLTTKLFANLVESFTASADILHLNRNQIATIVIDDIRTTLTRDRLQRQVSSFQAMPTPLADDLSINLDDVCRRLILAWAADEQKISGGDTMPLLREIVERAETRFDQSVSSVGNDGALLLRPKSNPLPWFDERQGYWAFDYSLGSLLRTALCDPQSRHYDACAFSMFDPIECQNYMSALRAGAFLPMRKVCTALHVSSPIINGRPIGPQESLMTAVQRTLMNILVDQYSWSSSASMSPNLFEGARMGEELSEINDMSDNQPTRMSDATPLCHDWLQLSNFLQLMKIAHMKEDIIQNSEGLLIEWTALAIRAFFIDFWASDAFIAALLFELSTLIEHAARRCHAEMESEFNCPPSPNPMPLPIFDRSSPVEVDITSEGGLEMRQSVGITTIDINDERKEYTAEWKLSHDGFFTQHAMGFKTSIILGGFYDFYSSISSEFRSHQDMVEADDEDLGHMEEAANDRNRLNRDDFMSVLNHFVIGDPMEWTEVQGRSLFSHQLSPSDSTQLIASVLENEREELLTDAVQERSKNLQANADTITTDGDIQTLVNMTCRNRIHLVIRIKPKEVTI